MAPCHTRRPRSVTEQPPLTPVRVAAGARNHRWTSDQPNISAPPIVATGAGTRHRDGSVVKRVNAASRHRVGRAGQAFHWWRLVVQGGLSLGLITIGLALFLFGAGATDSQSRLSSNSTVSLVGVTSIAVGLLGWWITIRAQHRWVGNLVDGVGITKQARRRVPSLGPRPVPLDLHTDLRVCPLALPRGAAFTPRMTAHLTPQQVQEAQRRIAVLRGLYGDLAEDLRHLERRRDLWAQVKTEQAALAELMPPVSEPLS